MIHDMTDVPANPNVQPSRYSPFWFRFFEILPGACVWLSLLSPFILSYYLPLSVTIFIIIFDIYWLILAFTYGGILINGYRRLQRNLKIDWQSYLHKIEEVPKAQREKADILDWRELYHAIILTTYKEQVEILDSSITSIIKAGYPKDHIILVLATEERDATHARKLGAYLKEKYGEHFRHFLVTEHPDGIVGEVKAKGANATWGARELTKWIDSQKIPYDRVIVSTADADSRFDQRYFNCLSYIYATTPKRVHYSYQPIAMYFNNIWQAPIISRILAFGTTFWQMIESVREYRLITFATHAMSLKTLVDIDYWCTSIVNEDSRQFFRAFFHYNGDFRVMPIFMPIYMDAVDVNNFWRTTKNLYLQQQRWAYGVEHFPYIVMEGLRRPKIRLRDRFMLAWRAFLDNFSWATASLFITAVGWIPITLNESFRDQVLAANFTVVTKSILSLTWVGILISAAVTLKLLPPPPPEKSKAYIFTMALQWILVPITSLVFGAFPGLDAQTRLMLGKYIGFRVTEKATAPVTKKSVR